MKAAYPLLFITAMTTTAMAQKLVGPTENGAISDTVQNAIDEFNRLKNAGKSTENEVIVVLDPPAPIDAPMEEKAIKELEAPPEDEKPEDEKPEDEAKDSKPVLVTGKPPGTTETQAIPLELEEPATDIVSDTVTESPEPAPSSAPEPDVRVESIRKGNGLIDPSQVKLKASFPVKPLSSAPEGWVLEKSEQAPVFRKEVELQPGTSISFSIKPHILAPGSDGSNTFSVSEPGFEASQGYLQKNTVGAILSTSVAQLDNDALQLGNAIAELHRLLASLPKTEDPKKP